MRGADCRQIRMTGADCLCSKGGVVEGLHIEVPARERSSDGLSADGMSASLDFYLQDLTNQHPKSGPAPSSRERWPTDERGYGGRASMAAIAQH